MIGIVALALGVTVGGGDFHEAFARAKHYAHDRKARAYIDATLLPALNHEMENAGTACATAFHATGKIEFTLVLSYRDGKPDRILLERDTPFGRCIADAFAKAELPSASPIPDLAEDLEVTMHFPDAV